MGLVGVKHTSLTRREKDWLKVQKIDLGIVEAGTVLIDTRRNCYKFKIGGTDNWPEVDHQTVECCFTYYDLRGRKKKKCVKFDTLCGRTCHKEVFAQVCFGYDGNIAKAALDAVKDCAEFAAGITGVAVIIAGPEVALPAFTEAFLECIKAKALGLIDPEISLFTEKQCGDWSCADPC